MAAILGLLVGLILGLTGAGGAIIAVPLLVLALDWDVARSAPVALVAVASSATVGAAIGLREGIVRFRAAALMATAGAVVTPFGIVAAHQLPAAPLALLFSALLLYVALRMYAQACGFSAAPVAHQRDGQKPCKLDADSGRATWTVRCARELVISGSVAGFLSGLFGVGGGFIVVPALRRATDLPMNSIVATSLMIIAFVSAFSVIWSAVTGDLNIAVALPFAAGGLAGMLTGRVIARRIEDRTLQLAFAAVATLVAAGLITTTLARFSF